MKIFHVFIGGNIGGIETLCKDYTSYSKHENIVVVLWGDGPLAEEMRADGKVIINLHASPRNIFKTVKYFLSLCEEHKPEVLIAHHAAPMSHLCLLAAKHKYPQIKTIAYAHGNAKDMCRAKDNKGLWVRKAILNISLQQADVVVAISQSVKESLIDWLNTPEEKIKVIYNGVQVNKFRGEGKHTNKTPRIIFVGRLIEEKGVQVILHSLSQIDPNLHYRMLIVGDGSYRQTLQEQCEELQLSERVEFYGSSRNVSGLLSEADIFIHVPVWEEGFGITIIEAMAAGLVCICSNSGAIPEIITEGLNGFIVPKNSSSQLGELIEEVLKNLHTERMDTIKVEAQLRAQDFSLEKFVINLDLLVEELFQG